MEEITNIKISELCSKVCSGGTPKSSVPSYYDGNIPWLNTKEINFNRIYSTEKSITEDGLNNSSAKWIDKNAVIVAMYGATAGKTAISKIPLTTNQACCNLMIDADKADYRFVYYALVSEYNRLASLANGGAQQNLNAQQIKDFEIPFFSLKDQKRIANILSTLDDKIELNRRINDNLEQQAQALFKSWFVDFEPFKDGKFVESEMGMIPEGWKVLNFNSFITPLNDKVHAGSLPEYSVTNNGIIPRSKKFSKQLSSSTSKNKIVKFNNIVFGMSREILNWGIMQDQIGSVSSAYHVYAINESIIPPLYLKFLMESMPAYFNDLIGTASREGQSLDKGALMNKLVYIPCIEIWKSFVDFSTSIRNKQSKNSNEMIQLVDLRDTLLPKLMSGELKINNLNC